MKDLVNSFIEFLEKTDTDIKFFDPYKDKKYIYINGSWKTPKQAMEFFNALLLKEDLEDPRLFIAISKPDQFKKLLMDFSEAVEIPKNENSLKVLGESLKGFINSTKDHYPVVSVEKTGKNNAPIYLLLDKDGTPTTIDARVWAVAHGVDLDGSVSPYFFQYRPDINKRFFKTQNSPVECLNTYVKPRWMQLERQAPKSLPKDFFVLLNQIPDKMDQAYFLHWMAMALIDKATSYLIIHGEGGGGKSKLKSVLSGLVGKNNYSAGKKSTLTTQFNSQLINKRLLAFDELKYDMDQQNVMKEIPNSYIAIEAKGMDPIDKKIHASLLIINNHLQDNYIPYDSRKFCPIGFSKVRLEKYLTPKEIEMLELKSDEDSEHYSPEWLADIGNWIMTYGLRPDLFPQGEYKGPKYWEICDSSMTKWQRLLITYIKDPLKFGSQIGTPILEKLRAGKMPYSEFEAALIKKTYRDERIVFPKSHNTPYIFLKHYRDLEGKEIIRVSEIFNPSIADFYVELLDSGVTSNAEDDL